MENSLQTPPSTAALKTQVHDFWNAAPCGEVYAEGDSPRERYETHGQTRYALEPYIADFARFSEGTGRDVLEIGVGFGADHLEWARAHPRSLTGVDLTERAIEETGHRLEVFGLHSSLRVADAERLPFAESSFDIVYSWGVLHHSPDTPRAIAEVHRVLRPGGTARIMIYRRWSILSVMLWLRFALLAGKPWRTLGDVLATHVESPGTKAYTVREAEAMCRSFGVVSARAHLSFGDLLEGEVGQRHRGTLLRIVKACWPRPLIRVAGHGIGSMLLIEARK